MDGMSSKGCFELRREWIVELRELVDNNNLPRSPGGFFFGHQWQDGNATGDKKQTLEFCDWALVQFDDGETVYYNSSW